MNKPVAVLLLAGGEGRRMGGQDKGLVCWRDKALYQHVLQRLQPQCGWLAISANRHLEQYRESGLPVYADAAAWQGMGPLGGVVTLAAYLPDDIDYVQLVPCDAPLLPHDLARRLLEVLQSEALAVCWPQTAQGPQPACALIRRQSLAGLPAYLAQGGRSLRGFFAQLDGRAVDFNDEQAFANCNDPAALAALARAR